MIHDPCAPKEAEEQYGLKLIEKLEIPLFSVVVLVAVHLITENDVLQWRTLLAELAVVVDVKGIVPREITSKAGVKLWRL